jgi:hypothetical protein
MAGVTHQVIGSTRRELERIPLVGALPLIVHVSK